MHMQRSGLQLRATKGFPRGSHRCAAGPVAGRLFSAVALAAVLDKNSIKAHLIVFGLIKIQTPGLWCMRLSRQLEFSTDADKVNRRFNKLPRFRVSLEALTVAIRNFGQRLGRQ